MTLTIGRFATGRSPARVSFDGDALSFGGMLFATSLENLEVQRQQLLGLDGNDDEPDVPVTWTTDDAIDGYYTVRSVTVTPIRAITYNQFKFEYSVQLTRVQGGFAAPLCEVAVSGAVRANGHSITNPSGVLGIPVSSAFRNAVFSDGQFAQFWTAAQARVSATGSVILAEMIPFTDPSFLSVMFATRPADHYDGAATIEQSVGGVWYPVIGEQIGTVVGNLLRVGNGLVRSTFHSDGAITCELFDGTVWESSTSFQIRVGGTLDLWIAEAAGWRILRNDPAACTIQAAASSDTSELPQTVTLHVERGKRMVEVAADGLFYARSQASDRNFAMELRAVSVTAATALTGGIRQTSNDANGHRWILTSASAVTNDLVNGRITIAAPGVPLVGQFGIGWELNGSASVQPDTAAQIASSYFVVSGTRQRIVAR